MKSYISRRLEPLREIADNHCRSEQDPLLVTTDVPNKKVSKRPYISIRVPYTEAATTLIANSKASQMDNCVDSDVNHNASAENIKCGTSQKKRKKHRDVGLLSSPTPLPAFTYCSTCGAKHFAYESTTICCYGGEVQIAEVVYPAELIHLFCSDDEISVHFRKYARFYNNMFAFSSLGGSIDARTEKGIYVFKLHGQLYHFVPNLLPVNNKPMFLQLYFYDGEHEKDNRSGIFPEIRDDVVDLLMGIMNDNPYAKFFRSLRHMDVKEDTRILLSKSAILDQRVYNAPTSEDVAAIWVDGTPLDETRSPYIVVWGKSDKSHRIYHYYGCYDPLQYPLLFPKGECGWHQGLEKMGASSAQPRNQMPRVLDPCLSSSAEELLQEETSVAQDGFRRRRHKVSCRAYYAYRLQIRPSNYLLRSGRLFQQFIVDMYVKLENTRLDFMRNNQTQLRAELYQGIIDTLSSGESNAANVGHKIILPASFIGSPRDMKKRYLNAMTLVQRFGKPDNFLTMTCNPNWIEIKQELASEEKAQDRPDLVARIFRAKLVTLKKKIKDDRFFGEVAAMIHVIEFQKRGLPHAHFLIILKNEYKIKEPDQFDQFVCAELPPSSNIYLRSLVVHHMMHGPCGDLNPQCQCMVKKNGKMECKSKYPRAFVTFTTNSEDGYPLYRRRNTGETILVRTAPLDNRSVIPYNPYLLAYFDCHINVEVCSTIKVVKYLYKYVYKGHDKICFSLGGNSDHQCIDEIKNYQSGRWCSPCESAWRIFAFDIYDMQPSVMPLQVHLPNMESIFFGPSEDLTSVAHNEKRTKTVLTEFFAWNAANPSGPKYMYSEFVEHFVWNAQQKKWTERKRVTTVGRLAFVAPTEGDRYHLRLLLSSVRGPQSFDDLLTIGHHKCMTFHEAALKRGLVEPDDLVDRCLDEAIEVQMPYALRRLFAKILIFLQPSNPSRLWTKYYSYLSEDYAHKNPGKPQLALELTSRLVATFLENMGKSLETFGLGHLCTVRDATVMRTKDIIDALDAPIPKTCIDARKLLNSKQRVAYKCIISHVKNNKPGLFFIDGPGGTGKTFLYCALYAKVRLLNRIVLPTATSGIAASNMPTGRTAHSRFKIPIDCGESFSCDVGKQSSLAGLLKETSLIIWDEATMARRENIESLDLLLRDICSCDEPFGGKIVVLGGDFRQGVPVVPKKTQKEVIEYSLVSSHLWPLFTRFSLTENIRAKEDPDFSRFLLSLGNGELQSHEDDLVCIPHQLLLKNPMSAGSLEQLIDVVFPSISTPGLKIDYFEGRAILTPKNEDVDSINDILIGVFFGDSHNYKSFDTIIDDSCNIYAPEFLNTLCPGGMSPHELVLKLNAPVILLRNLDPPNGLCNGTRLICKRFMHNLIECEICTGFFKGERVLIPRIKLRPPSSSSYPFQFQRFQFPIKLCFAMTINKSQGQTLREVGVYIRQPCFAHGQLYVALARAKKATNIHVFDDSPREDDDLQPRVRNVVSYEILAKAGVI